MGDRRGAAGDGGADGAVPAARPRVGPRASFRVADASRPSALDTFASVFDSGFLHLLDTEASDRLAHDLARAIVPGGRLYLHEFAVEFPVPNVPRAVTAGEARERFAEAAGWRVLHVAIAELANTAAARTRRSSRASNGHRRNACAS